MNENNNLDNTLDIIPLQQEEAEVAYKIIEERDIDKVKDLAHLFNLNQSKKNLLRVIKLNSLLDKVSDQMIERFEKTPGAFSNKDLLDYMQVTQAAIDRANKSLELIDETPAIQLQQNNQVNINVVDTLDRESRERITDAVKAILQRAKSIQSQGDDIIVENPEE